MNSCLLKERLFDTAARPKDDLKSPQFFLLTRLSSDTLELLLRNLVALSPVVMPNHVHSVSPES